MVMVTCMGERTGDAHGNMHGGGFVMVMVTCMLNVGETFLTFCVFFYTQKLQLVQFGSFCKLSGYRRGPDS